MDEATTRTLCEVVQGLNSGLNKYLPTQAWKVACVVDAIGWLLANTSDAELATVRKLLQTAVDGGPELFPDHVRAICEAFPDADLRSTVE